MATYGPNSPGTTGNNASVGSISWGTTDNAKVSDNSYATAALLVTQQSHYLSCSNFSFAVQSGDTIQGITVEIERKAGLSVGISDANIRLMVGGVPAGDNKSAGAAWSTTEAYVSFGGAADLWGLTPTFSQLNASNFGVLISCVGDATDTGSVDHVRITINYIEGDLPVLALPRACISVP